MKKTGEKETSIWSWREHSPVFHFIPWWRARRPASPMLLRDIFNFLRVLFSGKISASITAAMWKEQEQEQEKQSEKSSTWRVRVQGGREPSGVKSVDAMERVFNEGCRATDSLNRFTWQEIYIAGKWIRKPKEEEPHQRIQLGWIQHRGFSDFCSSSKYLIISGKGTWQSSRKEGSQTSPCARRTSPWPVIPFSQRNKSLKEEVYSRAAAIWEIPIYRCIMRK